MASLSEDARVTISLSRARKALSDHQKWMQKRQTGAFSLPGSTSDADLESSEREVDIASLMEHSLKRESVDNIKPIPSSPNRKSGLRVILPVRPPKNWKSLLRSKIQPIAEEKHEETIEQKPTAWEDPDAVSDPSEVKSGIRRESSAALSGENADLASNDSTSLPRSASPVHYSFEETLGDRKPVLVKPAKRQSHSEITVRTIHATGMPPEKPAKDGSDRGGLISNSSISVVDSTGKVLVAPESSAGAEEISLAAASQTVLVESRKTCSNDEDEKPADSSDFKQPKVVEDKVTAETPVRPLAPPPLKIKLSLSAHSLAELTKSIDVLLSPGGRRSRPPPPYELHRHSKLAQYNCSCPPYGINLLKPPSTPSSPVPPPVLSPSSSQSSLMTTMTTASTESAADSTDQLVTPLHRAARSGNARRLIGLIQEGANLNARDKDGQTPLMYCFASNGIHLHCADNLIRAGSSINEQANDGSTVLHEAVFRSALSFVQLLLHYGANLHVSDSEGRLPIHWASCNKSRRVLVMLLRCREAENDINVAGGGGMTPLMYAAYFDRPANVAELLGRKADPEEKDIDGKTAMHWAVRKDSANSLKLLLKHDRTFFKDRKGMTVLHTAAEIGSMPACELILRLRPDSVNDTDKEGRTPLHWAAVTSRVDVCALLLDRGADAAQRDDHGLTALDYARLKKLTYAEALLTCHDKALAEYAKTKSMQSVVLSSGLTNSVTSVQSSTDDDFTSTAMLVHGSWLGKFTNDCKGPLEERFFFLNMATGNVCWTKSPMDRHRSSFVSKMHVQEVHPEPSASLRRRLDFSPEKRDKYAFHVVGVGGGQLDLIAHSDVVYHAWVDGLDRFLLFGPIGVNPQLCEEGSVNEAWTKDAMSVNEHVVDGSLGAKSRNKIAPVTQ